MQQFLDKTNEHTLLIASQPELESAFRNVISELLAQLKEDGKSDQLVKRKAVNARLHVDNSTLWRWDKIGYLKAIHVGRSVFYRESDVRAIEEGRV